LIPRQPLEYAAILTGQPGALRFGPPFESIRTIQKEAVQESPPVLRHRFAIGTLRGGRAKLAHVALDDIGVQPQRICAKEQFVAELTTHGVEQLLKRVPRVLAGARGREVATECVAGTSPLPRHCEDREQGK